VFLAFPPREGAGGADRGGRFHVTGRPIPAGTLGADGARARERFELPPAGPCLLVFGGSLGARSLNEAAVEAFGAAPALEGMSVLHACGPRDHEELAARLAELGPPAHYRLLPYIQPFADALAAADLAAARAGGSIFELAAAGVPAVLVPYPHATADHQTGNARWMAEGGAATVVPDAELDAARLRREVVALLEAPERLATMRRSARALARPDAAERIADELLALAGPGAPDGAVDPRDRRRPAPVTSEPE
jgi:UDP-N-acetylglucosamine--N-acetylmuramyl-(pentapeptide) pyrophosphoryl-undecaprenol N-acetylglucosamine transferase